MIKSFVASSALLERLEKAFTAHTAAMTSRGIALINRCGQVMGLTLYQFLEDFGSDCLQDIPLFCRADAHLAKLRSDPVVSEAVLDSLSYLRI